MTIKNTFKEHVLRIIAVIGLIAVLLLGAWGIIQLAFFIPTFLSSLAGGVAKPAAKEMVLVSVPSSVTANQPFTLSWSHTDGNGQYSYAVSYSCADGLSVKAPLPTGALQSVPCNTPFNYTGAVSQMALTAANTATTKTPVSFAVSATKLSSGAVTATGSANTIVAAAPAPVKTAAKPAAAKYVANTQPRAALFGSPDLQVRVVSNLTAGVRAGSQVSLQFIVENVGTNVAPKNWIFTASLPYSPAYTYQSPSQPALYPGDKVVYTLGYIATPAVNQVCTQQYPNTNCTTVTNPAAGWTYGADPSGWMFAGSYNQNYGYGQTSSASVTVDPYNLVRESNESNNTAGVSYQVY